MLQGNGLSDAYTATLARLQEQRGNKSILGMKVLMWVLYSERPLMAEELCHALGVELGSTDLDLENVPALQTLLASSLGLVTVEGSSSTIRLVHFTLQEHLLSDSTLFHSPHSTIAEVCLTYLNFRCIRDLSPTLQSAPETMPLLEYASYYWGEHTKKGLTENIKILALRLLNKFEEHISAQLILLRYTTSSDYLSGFHFNSMRGPIGFTALHGGAFLGIVDIFVAVLEMKEWDVNAVDNASYTPLIWAALLGNEEVVKMLLERGDVNPELKGHSHGRRPLEWAAAKGHERVVKVLLEREDANPGRASPGYYQNALYSAAAFGHEGIVKIILAREDVNPNKVPSEYSGPPLSIAAWNEHEGVVKLFLEREDVNPNWAYPFSCTTLLMEAVSRGNEGIVKMLLERKDIRIDTPDGWNQTPLSLALSKGHYKIARMISERAAIKSNTADPGNEASLPPSAGYVEESLAEIELRDDHPNTNTADASEQPTSPPAGPDAPEELSD